MALLKCPDCDDNVSSFADKCPHCGYPIAKSQSGTVHQTPANTPAAPQPVIESGSDQVLKALAPPEPLTPPNGFAIKVGVTGRTNLTGGESSPVQRLEVTFDGKPIASNGRGFGEAFGPIPYELGRHSIRISAQTRQGSRIMDHTIVVHLKERGRRASYRFALLRISLDFHGALESAELDPDEVGQILSR